MSLYEIGDLTGTLLPVRALKGELDQDSHNRHLPSPVLGRDERVVRIHEDQLQHVD